jgi:hypothetical protein
MSEDLSKAPEDLEPEASRPGSAPAKRPLAEFLAEFEARLRDHPDEPATGAVQVVEDRAAGTRRGPAPVAPAAGAGKGAPEIASAPEIAAVPEIEVSAGLPVIESAPDIDRGAPEIVPEGTEAVLPPESESGSAEAAGESRRARGRRRRKHHHRAH